MFWVLFGLSNNSALGKNVVFRWFWFPQVVQEQTLGEVGMSLKYLCRKLLQSDNFFFKFRSKMFRMFFWDTVYLLLLWKLDDTFLFRDFILRLMTVWRLRGKIFRTTVTVTTTLVIDASYSLKLRIFISIFCALCIPCRFNFVFRYYVFMCALTGKVISDMVFWKMCFGWVQFHIEISKVTGPNFTGLVSPNAGGISKFCGNGKMKRANFAARLEILRPTENCGP